MSEYLELVDVETLCRQSLLVEEDENMAKSIECRQPSVLAGFQQSLRSSVIKPFSEIKTEIVNIAISHDFMYPGCKLENIRYLYFYNQAAEQWCYVEDEHQNKTQRASEGSPQDHIQSLNPQDQEHIRSPNPQDRDHIIHIRSMNPQDQEHIQSPNPQDQDDIQSLNPKDHEHIHSLNSAALDPSSSTDFEHVVFHAKKHQLGMSCVVRASTPLLEPAEAPPKDQTGGKSNDSGLGSSLSKPGQESTDAEGKDGPQSWKRHQ